MSNEKMREEFEVAVAAYLESTGQVARLDRFPDGRYEYVDISSSWWAWQASRAAIEVELPDPWFYPQQEYKLIAQDLTIKAIESLGLKVKP
jgi:hypothetical protein